jgi:hypothetical protein
MNQLIWEKKKTEHRGVHEPVQKDPTSKSERKVQKLVSKQKSGLSTEF